MNKLQEAGAKALLDQVTPLDAMQLCRKFNQVYNEKLDWHEFSQYLDALMVQGVLVVDRPGGFVQYRLA